MIPTFSAGFFSVEAGDHLLTYKCLSKLQAVLKLTEDNLDMSKDKISLVLVLRSVVSVLPGCLF